MHRSTDGSVHPCLRMRAEDEPNLGNHLRPFAAAVHATMARNNETPPLLPIPSRWSKMEFWKYILPRGHKAKPKGQLLLTARLP